MIISKLVKKLGWPFVSFLPGSTLAPSPWVIRRKINQRSWALPFFSASKSNFKGFQDHEKKIKLVSLISDLICCMCAENRNKERKNI